MGRENIWCSQSKSDRSPDQNCVPKLYRLCLPSLCSSPVCLCLIFICMSVLLCVHQKRDASYLSIYLCSHQGSTLSLPKFVFYPLCFLTAYKMMSCPSVIALASDSKNPDLYYLLLMYCTYYVNGNSSHFIKTMLHFRLLNNNLNCKPQECTKLTAR